MFACINAADCFDCSVLARLAYGFSPKVEATANNTVVLDVEGCETLFGSNRVIAHTIAGRANALGIGVNVAMADYWRSCFFQQRCLL